MKKLLIVCLAASALVTTACETTSSQPYKASTSNIVAIKKALGASNSTANVGGFTASNGVDMELTCRAMGAIEVAPGKTALKFIEEALTEEMFAAGVYDPESATTIQGEITQFEADSWGEGTWDVGMKLSSASLPQGLTVSTSYKFKSSFSAMSACQNVVDAFTPTVQDLIGKAIAHPDFTKLAQ